MGINTGKSDEHSNELVFEENEKQTDGERRKQTYKLPLADIHRKPFPPGFNNQVPSIKTNSHRLPGQVPSLWKPSFYSEPILLCLVWRFWRVITGNKDKQRAARKLGPGRETKKKTLFLGVKKIKNKQRAEGGILKSGGISRSRRWTGENIVIEQQEKHFLRLGVECDVWCKR